MQYTYNFGVLKTYINDVMKQKSYKHSSNFRREGQNGGRRMEQPKKKNGDQPGRQAAPTKHVSFS